MLLGVWVVCAGSLSAYEATDADDSVERFLSQHCHDCHGSSKPKADFQHELLSLDFDDDNNRQQWQLVLEQIKSGKMPPKEKPLPEVSETRRVGDWISERVSDAEIKQNTMQGRVVLRRLASTQPI